MQVILFLLSAMALTNCMNQANKSTPENKLAQTAVSIDSSMADYTMVWQRDYAGNWKVLLMHIEDVSHLPDVR